MRHIVIYKSLLAASGLAILMSSGPLLAQTTDSTEATGAGEARLDDIVVTAQKRAENIQDVPLAISAVTGSTLTERHVIDPAGLAQIAPNVTFNAADGETRIGIRGITFTNLDSTAAEARVAYYLDGVYVSRSNNISGTIFDVDRIEVLRGPQGTLFGRNAIAGAVSLITKSPTDSFQGYIQGDVGTHKTINGQAAIGGPIVEGVSFRIAGMTLNHGAYGHNLTTDSGLDNLRQNAARAKLKLEPSSNFSVTLSTDYYRKRDHSGLFFQQYAIPGTAAPGGGLIRPAGKPRDSYSDVANITYSKYYSFSSTVEWKMGDRLSMTSISAYRNGHDSIRWDGDYTNLELFSPSNAGSKSQTFSQETRIQKDFDAGNFVAGVYYFWERYLTGTHIPFETSLFGLPSFRSNGILFGGLQRTSAIAGFAQGTYNPTDSLHITVGARYGTEKKRVTKQYFAFDLGAGFDPAEECRQPCNLGSLPAGTPFSPDASKRWHDFSPRVTIQYDLDESKNIYATYGKGFKSGGFNVGADTTGLSFNPEKLNDYEVGLKADFLDHRLRTNIAAFFYDYKDLQVSQILATPQAVLVNAAKARVYGIEAEILAKPTEGLQLDLAGSLTKSKFTEFLTKDPKDADGPNGDPDEPFDLSGNRLPSAPSYTATYGIQYTWPSDIGDLTFRAEGISVSRIYFDEFNAKSVSAAPNTKVNLFINYESADKSFYGSIYARNVTNVFRPEGSQVSTGLINFPVQGGFIQPRTIGVTFGVRLQ